MLAVGDRIDLDDFSIGARPVILRKLAERPLGFANRRQNAALDDDLRMRRHTHPVGPAFDHFDRPAKQRAGDFHLVLVKRRDRLRRKNAGRMHPDHERDLKRLARLLGHSEIVLGVARQEQYPDSIRTADLAAVDGDVLNSCLRVARNQ